MRDSFFKLFGSVRLVQEVSRSASSSPTSTPTTELPNVDLSHHQQYQSTETSFHGHAQQQPLMNDRNDLTNNSNNVPLLNNESNTTTTTTPTPSSNTTSMPSLTPTLFTVPQPNYPVSLASYLPGMSLYTPGYANPRTLPSWMVNNSSNSTTTLSSSTSATTSASTSSLNARSKRKHTRKNSLYSVRHHRPKQPSLSAGQQQLMQSMQQDHVSVAASASPHISSPPTLSSLEQQQNTPLLTFNNKSPSSIIDDKFKPKSQKLLCLWPLPVITRYMIGISLLVSTLNFLGFFHLKCSSPSFVIHRLEIVNLLLSPFLFTGSLHTFLLFGWNILILGLFEESLAHMLGGTRRFVKVLVGILLSVCMIRQGIGYVFSKSTGFAVPTLFFSDSLHECNQGLAPFLFALLIVQSLSIDDKYILMYGPEESNQKITVRKVALQLLMCLVNYTVKNILWWSLTGLLTGYIMTIVIQTCLARQRNWFEEEGEHHQPQLVLQKESLQQQEKKENSSILSTHSDDNESFMYHHRRMPLWRLLWSAVKKGAVVVMITLPVLLMCNAYYTRETFVDPSVLNQVTHDRYMFSFVVMTAPRRGDPAFLSRTLESYLANWPTDPAPGSLYDRIQALVYTHFTNHSQYNAAQERFSNDPKGQQYLTWIREQGDAFDQRLHVSKALSLAADHYQSTYIALLEDDFPVCGENEWRQIENVVYNANQKVPGHCGVFVGTGGR
ncbi:hypothetical protein BDA99DRAFT_546374 [Phascolomyces articulosus]|uniref:Uncharacterized protein n=1 Tax=Phascolomyces articulosus TaxID=60185 RepID=A0AAD5PF80_9FUNG|nr:hypothetical protein BDA99DRAFT_546374 [Phascolomyces articulosus]